MAKDEGSTFTTHFVEVTDFSSLKMGDEVTLEECGWHDEDRNVEHFGMLLRLDDGLDFSDTVTDNAAFMSDDTVGWLMAGVAGHRGNFYVTPDDVSNGRVRRLESLGHAEDDVHADTDDEVESDEVEPDGEP